MNISPDAFLNLVRNSEEEVAVPVSIGARVERLNWVIVLIARRNRDRRVDFLAKCFQFFWLNIREPVHLQRDRLFIFNKRKCFYRRIVSSERNAGARNDHRDPVVSVCVLPAFSRRSWIGVASFPLNVDEIFGRHFQILRREVVLDRRVRLHNVASAAAHAHVDDLAVVVDFGRTRRDLEEMRAVLEHARNLRVVDRQLRKSWIYGIQFIKIKVIINQSELRVPAKWAR